jgi:hypothetical protein
MRALLLNLSDKRLKQSQINTVVVQQEEMDRVGVEPTTSAMPVLKGIEIGLNLQILSKLLVRDKLTFLKHRNY